VQLVEQHCISKSDPRFAVIDAAAFASKNLYNQATYQIRQAYIHEGKYLPYAEIYHRVKHLAWYQALPRKVSNSLLILIDKNWRAFRNALKAWYEEPSRFTGKPRLPGYKHKEKGRAILIYDMQAIGKKALKRGIIVPSGLGIEIGTKQKRADIDQVRIVPRGSCYVVEVVYRKAIKQADVDLHTASRRIIDTLVKEGIGLLVIGKNRYWKQDVEMGKKKNQQFVQIPHARFIGMLTYKAELVGIKVIIREESYTSKASFLDLDPIPTYERALAGTHQFSGSRSGRWYRSQHGRRMHSDTNGSYNILRKAVPTAFEAGVEGFAVIPRQLAIFK